MQRDFELIRKILIAVEETDPSLTINGFNFNGEYDNQIVLAHVELLVDKGLLKGVVVPKTISVIHKFL